MNARAATVRGTCALVREGSHGSFPDDGTITTGCGRISWLFHGFRRHPLPLEVAKGCPGRDMLVEWGSKGDALAHRLG